MVVFRVNAVETGLEQNVETILRNLLGNLASLGYEHGYKAATTVLPETTTTDNPYKGMISLHPESISLPYHNT